MAGSVDKGAVVLDKSRVELEPRLDAFPTLDELRGRQGDPTLALVDVRHPEEFSGQAGAPCDPRQGHIPGATNVEVSTLFSAPGQPRPAADVKALAALADDADVVTYCHSGSRSALAMIALRAAGYRARNYVGSWHEWSRRGPAGRALGGNGDPLGGFDEVPTERPPELLPLGRLPVVLGEELVSRAGNLVRSSASHDSRVGRVISGWNWTAHTVSPSLNACVQLSLRRAPGRRSAP